VDRKFAEKLANGITVLYAREKLTTALRSAAHNIVIPLASKLPVDTIGLDIANGAVFSFSGGL